MNPAAILSLVSVLLPIAGQRNRQHRRLKKAHGDANKIQAALLLLMPAAQTIAKLPQTPATAPVTVNLPGPGVYTLTFTLAPQTKR